MSVELRVAAVRSILAENGWHAILITNPANRSYLTGFTADDHAADESSGALVISQRTAELCVSPTNLSWAKSEVDQHVISVVATRESWVASAAEHMESLGAGKVAVEDATTPAASWFTLQETVGSAVILVRANDAVDALRAQKTPEEIELLAQAASCTDLSFAHAVSRFKPGMTERQAADLVREALQQIGSDGEAFDTIVAAGANAAKPHHRPGGYELQANEPIIIDMGARIDGYNGDLTRTVCLGKPEERLVTIYEAVLAAQAAGLGAIRSGTQASSPDLATRDVFAGLGLENHVIHSAGHGLGLRVHEAPSVSKRATGLLESGNVVTMEPGLYIPDWGGVRIEDVAVVEDGGYRNLTTAPKGIESMTI
ncbi:aminopeptidase P family protein [soil metagenome]